ncbi:hypothetical protein [Achromobacter phage Motura]|uniref:Uncharacterized protein n=1 Tax=Achromobacter phage Motura TaxID=2591403 RepID=A0A514CSU9_9CAUD|nr:hypothetical protein H1O15_gp244 [Achromobacter phage Motura]QDH83544.1 hypothetical protein [Achromobacter phage Motura]
MQTLIRNINQLLLNIFIIVLLAVVVVASFHLWGWMGVFISALVIAILLAFGSGK